MMTTPAYVSSFGLKAEPFSKEIDDAELWLPSSKQELVADLCDALQSRASVMLVGDPGVAEYGAVELDRLLQVRVEPDERGDGGHGALLSCW